MEVSRKDEGNCLCCQARSKQGNTLEIAVKIFRKSGNVSNWSEEEREFSTCFEEHKERPFLKQILWQFYRFMAYTLKQRKKGTRNAAEITKKQWEKIKRSGRN